MAANRRLIKELKDLTKDPSSNCSAGLIDPNNLFHWEATIIGPSGCPYEGGIFKLEIVCPPDYPFVPPKVKFNTRIFHPNITPDGRICLNILKDNWSPSLTIDKVLCSISSLLTEPNPHDPLVAEIGKLYLEDKNKFDKIATEWTLQYAN